jgi:UDP-N-acetylmuramoyl-tripeptide--D-alanyl-D-alanine ligase
MKNALQILTNLAKSRADSRTVFICGDMAELGNQSARLHAELGEHIAEAKVRLLITVGKDAQITANTTQKLAKDNILTKTFDNAAVACDNLKDFIENFDIILVKGSRSAGLEAVIDKLAELYESLDDAKAANNRDN